MWMREERGDDAHASPPVAKGDTVQISMRQEQRDSSARFTALIPLHTTAMLRVAAALVGIGDAEDAAQEALLRAWQAMDSLRDWGAFRPWILRITVNVCREWQRGSFGRRAHLTQSLPEDEDTAIWESLARLGVNPGTSDHTRAIDLRSAINRLPAEFRVVIVLRYYGRMDSNEIGEALGVPAGTVRTRLHRALQKLRESLRDVGIHAPYIGIEGE